MHDDNIIHFAHCIRLVAATRRLFHKLTMVVGIYLLRITDVLDWLRQFNRALYYSLQ